MRPDHSDIDFFSSHLRDDVNNDCVVFTKSKINRSEHLSISQMSFGVIV